jgi:DNA-binding winged helix-turn-helix (wHTH) protein
MEKRAHAGGNAEFSSNVRFGPFELDLRRRELRKEGRKIRLQEQPFQILKILLESPGEVVSREEIRERLWPDETVVEFDHSINAAIRRLRDALRDSADNPRYIKTIARQGYCFVGKAQTEPATLVEPIAVVPEVVVAENELTNPQPEETPPGPGRPLNPRMVVPVLLVTIALIVWASGVVLQAWTTSADRTPSAFDAPRC